MKIPKYRSPTHPGEMLLKEFLEPMQITQQALAQAIGVPYQRVNELVNQKRGVTPLSVKYSTSNILIVKSPMSFIIKAIA